MKREVESEIDHQTDADDLSRLVSGLKQVEAPRNFDRGVMTKIADGSARSRRIFGMPLVFTLAPLLILLALIATFVIFVTQRNSIPSQPEVAGTGSSQFTTNQNPAPAAVSPSVEQNTVASNPPTEHRIAPPVEPPSPPNSTKQREVTPPGGGSFVEGVNRGRVVSPQPQLNSAQTQSNRDEAISSNSVPVRDVLSTLGITAEYSGGWIVRRIAANSQAEHSGLKVGDAIVALGDTALSVNTEFKGQFSASAIRVRRNGQILDLNLK